MAIKVQHITDLCIAINCVEGINVDPKYVKQNMRVGKNLRSLMMKEAQTIIDNNDASIHDTILKRLTMALLDAGWENRFILSPKTGNLKIVSL